MSALRVGDHRPKLVHREETPVLPDALLPEDHRPGRIQANGERDQAHDRQRAEKEGAAQRQIDEPLGHPLEAVDHGLAQPDQRQAAEVVDPGAGHSQIEEIRDRVHAQRKLPQRHQQAGQPLLGVTGKGEDDVGHPPALDDGGDFIEAAQHGAPVHPAPGRGIVVDEPGDGGARRIQRRRRLLAQRPGPGDEHHGHLRSPPHRPVEGPQHPAVAQQQQEGPRHEIQEHDARHAAVRQK